MINLFNLKSQEKFFFKLKPENLDPQLTKEVMSLTEIHLLGSFSISSEVVCVWWITTNLLPAKESIQIYITQH